MWGYSSLFLLHARLRLRAVITLTSILPPSPKTIYGGSVELILDIWTARLHSYIHASKIVYTNRWSIVKCSWLFAQSTMYISSGRLSWNCLSCHHCRLMPDWKGEKVIALECYNPRIHQKTFHKGSWLYTIDWSPLTQFTPPYQHGPPSPPMPLDSILKTPPLPHLLDPAQSTGPKPFHRPFLVSKPHFAPSDYPSGSFVVVAPVPVAHHRGVWMDVGWHSRHAEGRFLDRDILWGVQKSVGLAWVWR